MIITTVRLPDELHDKLWKIHADTRESINKIIVRLIREGIGIETEQSASSGRYGGGASGSVI